MYDCNVCFFIVLGWINDKLSVWGKVVNILCPSRVSCTAFFHLIFGEFLYILV